MTSIAGHSCNRFEPEERRKVDDARRQLRRYEHYYKRFQGHGVSCRTERDELGPAVAARVAALESRDSVLTKDASWLGKAHRTLLRGRDVLARSYVFAYYMFDDDGEEAPAPGTTMTTSMWRGTWRQELFEDYQEQVEGNVERLSGMLAEDVAALPDEEVLQARQHAINLVRTLEAHCEKMHGCIQDELLPMLVEPMSIGAYQPGGPSKANELPD